MEIIALIPARGGSKRIPRKNIADLDGQPILSYTIRLAFQSKVFDDVYVSTEDDEIASIAQKYGAKVIDRPDEIAGDRSTVTEVCLHALETLPDAEIICCIYATAVLVSPETLVKCRDILTMEPSTDFLMGVSKFRYPPVQALLQSADGYLSYMWPEWRRTQSQFHPNLLVSNGTFYWARTAALIRERTFYGQRLKGHLVPDQQVCDVDLPDDLIELRTKFTQKK